MKAYFKHHFASVGLVLAALSWGSTYYLIKGSLGSVNPVTLVGYRFVLAAAVLGLMLILRRRHPVKRLFSNLIPGLVLGLLTWLICVPQTIGLGYTSATNSAFISGLYLAFLPIFSLIFFKKLPTRVGLVALGLSLTGLWLLTGGPSRINVGDLLTLIAAAASAGYILLASSYRKLDPYILSFQAFLAVGLSSLVIVVIKGLPMRVSSVGAWQVILFLAVVPTVFAYVVELVAEKKLNPTRTAVILALDPVFGALFAWTAGKEQFYASHAFGGLLIVAAIVVASLPFRSFERKTGGRYVPAKGLRLD